ncbi:AraC family transcriptional regulator [Clostridium swellfunianum]|uniref:AraC family transcriptional regulator n=1 Tax=Clostridium swellfunianum TaxID=1367462 RepID=UPI00202FE420|nr:AraC family transcriptional regulator [Clostridium swellfunianum]MCM0648098.1 AraC family transcriptional regulator [Clostridium swellfunianum]
MSSSLFEFKHSDVNRINIKFLYISKSKYDYDWHSIMHTHSFTELFYVVSGRGSFRIEDKIFTVKEDDLVIVNPHVAHTESSKDSSPLEYIVVGVDGISLAEAINEEDLKNHGSFSIHNYSRYRHEMLSYMNNLLYEVENKNEHYEVICQNLLEVLILNVKRRIKSDLVISAEKKTTKECNYIKNYIDVHYSSDLNLDYLASITHMSKYYLVRVFKKFMGVSPIEYLISKRISVAKLLLETTDYSIDQIIKVSGFNSQSYFNQVFKERVGISPTKYKKQYTDKKIQS